MLRTEFYDQVKDLTDEELLDKSMNNSASDGLAAIVQWRSANKIIKTMEDLDRSNDRLARVNLWLTVVFGVVGSILAAVQVWSALRPI
jgi:hypothetical protein